MRLSLLAVLSAVSIVSLGCGTPQAGDTCNQTGFLCESTHSALECRGGKWVSLPCKGDNGCVHEADTVKCDMTGDAEGDACATSAAGKGLCTFNGDGTLECRDQGGGNYQLVKTNDCRTCSVSGDMVVCTP